MNHHSLFLSLAYYKYDKQKYIKQSNNLISKLIGQIIIQSSIFKSKRYTMYNTYNFDYIILQITTKLSPGQILEKIVYIESILGVSNHSEKRNIQQQNIQCLYKNKIIDIDILFYDNIIVNSKKLQIPHPLLHLRKFILIPMCEIKPYQYHPIFNMYLLELLGIYIDN
ncbi:2-amino-4-hydroxy-6-hydroxymethyldihydropteridine diphosphokinase [Blattabacterium cuenoti]|uniref:2-amino-4-hydroxy-6- hydroxymethyldihydropteridine diphosphokinase n=1 Tax=Blattabacterium cuenoti TaxID=1653831 RepID=UPI00163CFE9C|nr:2-amino-4-hydroxy-6-hydroxymethyldihydropteridine diphosphokinase [Blattabacterium cuenoti]